jgi:uncharacterized repeat protein (TIGR01451 family)
LLFFPAFMGGFLARCLCLVLLSIVLCSPTARAQTVYGSGASAIASSNDSLFSVDPVSGKATYLCRFPLWTTIFGSLIPIASNAIGVNPATGLVHYIQTGADPPRIGIIDPLTCVASTPVISDLQSASFIRATFCPDGRFYASTNNSQLLQISPVTSAVEKTITLLNIPLEGSGDIACTSNGDFYLVAPGTVSNPLYALYKVDGAVIHEAVNGGSVRAARVGWMSPGVPLGLSEVGQNLPGCAASLPCLIASVSDLGVFYTVSINAGTGASRRIGAMGYVISDLARSFPVDVIVGKTAPATVLQGQAVRYSVTVGNAGPGPVESVRMSDVFPSTTFGSISWTCSVIGAGTDTQVATACSAPGGSGNIDSAVSLSRWGTVQFTIDATLYTPRLRGCSSVG